ncbi:MAG: sulfate adenylyltransferase, partial [Actinomycetota bacterium]|nr:sulfate adenylyltransferase [Actinomycetota bacterium]
MLQQDPIAPHGGTLVDLLVPETERNAAWERAGNLPKLTVNARELSDLEMLAVGALSPLTGFQAEKDYRAILDGMHLSGGLPWTIPVTLSLDEEERKRIGGADEVALTTEDGGEPLAVVSVEDVYKRDREAEATGVFGTTDLE